MVFCAVFILFVNPLRGFGEKYVFHVELRWFATLLKDGWARACLVNSGFPLMVALFQQNLR